MLTSWTGSANETPYYKPSGSGWGGVGLMQMRTARFHADGTLDVGAALVDPYRRYFVNFQAMPWLEATFRYTDIRNRLFSQFQDFSGGQSFKDRGFDLKIRLLEESRYIPQIAFGWQDALGTGLFSSEYFAFSKRYYDFDFTVGLAWGYLGSAGTIENPLINFSDRFRNRGGSVGLGGEANIGSFLTGPTIGLFAGVEWTTPINGLVLKAEYDGNNYQNEPLDNNFEQDFPLNFGVSYRPFAWLEASASVERGNTAAFRVSLRANVHDSGIFKLDPPPPLVTVRKKPGSQALEEEPDRSPYIEPGQPIPVGKTDDTETTTDGQRTERPVSSQLDSTAVDNLFDGVEAVGFQVESIEVTEHEVRAVFHGDAARHIDDMAVELAQIVTAALPVSADRVTLIERANGTAEKRISINRSQIQRADIVDHLFDTLELRGYEVESLDISHEQVTIALGARSPENEAEYREIAQVILNAVPTPVQRAAFVRSQAGIETARVLVHRDQIKQHARIDDLFDALEARGVQIESIDLTRDTAVAHVSVQGTVADDAYETAAHLISDASPMPVKQVVVVGLQAGLEVSRFTLNRRRSGAGSQAGDDVEETVTIVREPQELSREEKVAIADKMTTALEKERFIVDAVQLTRYEVTVFVSPTRFRQFARNVGRAARVVSNHVPDSVELITVVTLAGGLETSRVTIARTDLEQAVSGRGSAEEIWQHAKLEAPHSAIPPGTTYPDDAIRNPGRYPSFNWGIAPKLRQHIGGPDQFYLYQIWLALSGTVELARGLSVSATLGKNVINTFDEIELTSDSQLPRVRSDIKEYLQQGENNIARLQANYLFQPHRDWFARVSAGLFEEMFGGVGGEVLYRPYGSRFAIGVDVNRVRQRAFDQRFEFRDYQVTTGHVNAFYKLPFANLLAEVHAGQFLAGDRGAQFVISRGFDSGVRVGAWATFTNVSAEEFGEGSFDKGFFISIPYELLLLRSTRSSGSFGFRPLSRDGGQRLSIRPRLYPLVESGNIDSVSQDWRQLLD